MNNSTIIKMTTINKYYSLSLLNSRDEHISFSDGSFYLSHGTEYKVLVSNSHSWCRANAKVSIDGKRVGDFRIGRGGKIVIERPDDDRNARKLTFYDASSEEGQAGRIDTSSPDLGKVVVEIQKERKPDWSDDSYWHAQCQSDSVGTDEVDGGVGGTALGRASKQKFYEASHIDVDPEVYRLEARMTLIDAFVVPL